MADTEKSNPKTDPVTITPLDILFECPACGKSLVVDQAAEGLTVVCPQCHIDVIVPPKSALAAPPPPPSPPSAPPPQSVVPASTPPKPAAESPEAQRELASLHAKLMTLSGQLKELQTQRTEVANRIASRLNDVNRDLVMMARLETTQQQILTEWNQVMTQIGALGQSAESEPKSPAKTESARSGSQRTQVSFRG